MLLFIHCCGAASHNNINVNKKVIVVFVLVVYVVLVVLVVIPYSRVGVSRNSNIQKNTFIHGLDKIDEYVSYQ